MLLRRSVICLESYIYFYIYMIALCCYMQIDSDCAEMSLHAEY